MSDRTTTASTSRAPGGAVATAHPAATRAALQVLALGGSASDAAIAAQAVICVVMPQAAGLGGDMLALVRDEQGVASVNGSGCSPARMTAPPHTDGGTSVTVPGLVDGWAQLHRRWGRLPLEAVLEPAVALARGGVGADPSLLAAVAQQRPRLEAGGASAWPLLRRTHDDHTWVQPELADLLDEIGRHGRDALYRGPAAEALVAAVHRHGGSLSLEDLAAHRTPCPSPLSIPWGGGTVHVQPPASQGVLLAMALQEVCSLRESGVRIDEHVLVEVTSAVFAHRARCGRGAALLEEQLDVDLAQASGRSGPRAYLHTAGVATADRQGQVVSSLVSVFDDFGSGVFVPELGLVLNNRAAGFTEGDNAPAPGARPVHTLAPAMLVTPDGALGLATPGADGQVQTLLQVLAATSVAGAGLDEAIAAPRWRSQDGDLLVERGHAATGELLDRGHRVVPTTPGADVFGAVVAAGASPTPYAVADWRRSTDAGGAP